MIIRKKDVPSQLHGMWYAGVLNLGICYINLVLFVMNGNLVTFIGCCIPLAMAVFVLKKVQHRAEKITWEKLTSVTRSTSYEEGL